MPRNRERKAQGQHLDRSQAHALFVPNFFGNERQGMVDAVHAFQVDRHAVEKNAGQRMAGDLRQRGIDLGARPGILVGHAPCSDHQNLVGTEVYRG